MPEQPSYRDILYRGQAEQAEAIPSGPSYREILRQGAEKREDPSGDWSILGGVAGALDVLRRGRDVLGGQLGNLLYPLLEPQAAAMEQEMGVSNRISWGETWRRARTGESLIQTLSPKFAEEHPSATWWLGLGHEIFTDPLNVAEFGALTKAGKAAKKVGKLAGTWAEQAVRGERAFAQVFYPTVKAGRIALGQRTIARSPGAVKAMGAFGRFMTSRWPLSAFRTRSLNPAIRAARAVAEQGGAEVQTKLLALQDAAVQMTERIADDLGPEAIEHVYRAAEHVGLGGRHLEELAQYTPEIIREAEVFKAMMDTAGDIAEGAGLKRPTLGGAIQHGMQEARGARVQEIGRLRKQVEDMASVLGKSEQKAVKTYLDLQEKAAVSQMKAVSLADEALDIATQASRVPSQRTPEMLRGLSEDFLRKEAMDVPLTHVSGLGMGQNEFAGTYLSTELAGNRYATVGRPAQRAKATFTNPKNFRTSPEYQVFREQFLPAGKTIEDVPWSDIPKLGEQATEALKAQGFDAVYLPEGDINEGILVVFDKTKVTVGGKPGKEAARFLAQRAKREIGKKHSVEAASNLATLQARKMESQAARAQQKAMRFADEADRIVKGAGWEPFSPKLQKLDDKLVGYSKLQDDLPNYIPHVLSQKTRRYIMQNFSEGAKANRLWSDQFSGIAERHFAMRYDPKTLRAMHPAEKFEALLRPMSVNETEAALKVAAAPGSKFGAGRMQKYAKLASEEGLFERMARIFKTGVPEPQAGRIFEMDPGKVMERLNRNIVHAVQGKSFIDEMAKHADIFSRTLVDDSWFPIKEVSKQLADTVGEAYIHPDLFRELRRTYTQAFRPDSMSAIIRGYDKITQWFKFGVTQLFPAYHWRNNVSDFMLMGYNGTYSPGVVMKEGTKAAVKKGKIACGPLGELAAEEVNRMARAYGVTFGEAAAMGIKGKLQLPENIRRMGYFVDRLQHGFSPYQASLDVKKVLFDYGDLSDFERTVLKRAVPFYSWIRNNLRLQAGTLLRKPALVQAQMRLGFSTQKVEDVPSWIRGRMMIGLSPDAQTGEERILTGLGSPVEDLTELLDMNGGWQEWVRQIAWRANPLLKLGIGATGYDIERARKFEYPTNAPYLRWVEESHPNAWEFLQRKAGARKQKAKDGTPYYTIDPKFDWFLRNTPIARGVSTVKAIAGGRMGPLAFLTGYRALPYDPEKERTRTARRKSWQELIAKKRVGDVGFFVVPYKKPGGLTSKRELDRLKKGLGR